MKNIDESEEFNNKEYVHHYTLEDVMNTLLQAGFEPTGVLYYRGKKVYNLEQISEIIDEITVVVSTPASEHKCAKVSADNFSFVMSLENIDGSSDRQNYSKLWQDYNMEKYGAEYANQLLVHVSENLMENIANKKNMTSAYAEKIQKNTISIVSYNSQKKSVSDDYDAEIDKKQKQIEKLTNEINFLKTDKQQFISELDAKITACEQDKEKAKTLLNQIQNGFEKEIVSDKKRISEIKTIIAQQTSSMNVD